MISLEDLRKLLPDNENLTDKELLELREQLYGIGDLAFEVWLEDKKKK
jgi:hypothetical protein